MSRVEGLQLNRVCVSMQAEDKGRRRRAIEGFKKSLFEDEQEPWEVKDLMQIWQNVHRNIVGLLSDPSEACRDLAIELLKKFFGVLPPCDKNIVYIVPVMARRLGSQETMEPSEEVRLNSIGLLRIITSRYKDHLPAYLDDLVTILSKTVTDNFPNVKKESCECISELAKSIPRYFYNRSESLVKPILTNFSHQHYKVRVASVKSIGDVIQYGNNKSIEDVATPMAERLFDQSGAVRMAVVEVAGRWLLELRDRYSWWHKLIPLLITGLHDEIEDIRNRAGNMWDAAGKLYMQENESDEKFKDKMDFLTEDLPHYPRSVVRPNLGCRTIAQQNLCKLIGGIGVELGDWMADIRVRSAQLLCVLVLNVEQDVTQHIEKILPPMYRACNDDDTRVVENVELAAEYMGYFVPPDIYCHQVLPTLEESPSAGHFRVFAGILRGSQRKGLFPKLEEIGNFLQQEHICRCKKANYQEQLLRCCESLIVVCEEDCRTVSQDLFTVIFTAMSLATEEIIQRYCERLLKAIAKIEELKNVEEVYQCHLRLLLRQIYGRSESWTIYSSELHILQTCLKHTGPVASRHLDLILPMLKETMSKDTDPELRLKQFILMSDYLMRRDETLKAAENLPEFINAIIEDMITPSLVWTAGRTAEAIRTAAVCCLCAALDDNPSNSSDEPPKDCESELEKKTIIDKQDEILDDENEKGEDESTKSIRAVGKISSQQDCNRDEKSNNGDRKKVVLFPTSKSYLALFQKVVPILITLVDDNAKKTRLYSLRAICLIMAIGKRLTCITEDHVHQVYPVVLKRLDDGCDNVRITAVKTLTVVWEAAPKDYDLVFSKSHVDALYTSAIVHLDDPDPAFQELMLDAMMLLGKVHPEFLSLKIQKCKANFRNQSGLDKLLKHTHNLLAEKLET